MAMWLVNIGDKKGQASPGNKPLPEPLLTQIYHIICYHKAWLKGTSEGHWILHSMFWVSLWVYLKLRIFTIDQTNITWKFNSL